MLLVRSLRLMVLKCYSRLLFLQDQSDLCQHCYCFKWLCKKVQKWGGHFSLNCWSDINLSVNWSSVSQLKIPVVFPSVEQGILVYSYNRLLVSAGLKAWMQVPVEEMLFLVWMWTQFCMFWCKTQLLSWPKEEGSISAALEFSELKAALLWAGGSLECVGAAEAPSPLHARVAKLSADFCWLPEAVCLPWVTWQGKGCPYSIQLSLLHPPGQTLCCWELLFCSGCCLEDGRGRQTENKPRN